MKVLSADDHSIFRAGLKPLLDRLEPGVTVLEADSFGSALELVAANADLDLILLDLLMPGMDAFEGLAALRERVPDVPVVVVSMIEDRKDVLRAIDLGALGYVPKTAPPEELLEALRRVLAGDVYLPPSVLTRPPAEAGPRAVSARTGVGSPEQLSVLTPRQREVVGLLGQGMTNAQIASELGLSESTVRLHVSTILDRLNLNNRTQVALLAARAFDGAAETAKASTRARRRA